MKSFVVQSKTHSERERERKSLLFDDFFRKSKSLKIQTEEVFFQHTIISRKICF